MRTAHRFLAPLVASVLALGLLGVTGPAAHAEEAEKAEREISINGKEPQENRFLVKGKIAPSTGGPVDALIEVKHCRKDRDCGAKWRTFDKIRTNKKGRYSERVRPPKRGHERAYYRVATKEDDSFLAAVSQELYIERSH